MSYFLQQNADIWAPNGEECIFTVEQPGTGPRVTAGNSIWAKDARDGTAEI